MDKLKYILIRDIALAFKKLMDEKGLTFDETIEFLNEEIAKIEEKETI